MLRIVIAQQAIQLWLQVRR